MRRWQRYASLVLLLTAAVVVFQALVRLGLRMGDQPGPGLMPLVLGVLLGALAAALLAGNLGPGEAQAPFWAAGTWWRPLGAVALMAGFAFGLRWIGFMAGIGLLVAGWLLILERKRLWVAALSGAVTATVVYALFVVLLKVPLPMGSLLTR
ncbi:MAG: tripartite tricarboxylate transporter TctB family protein [Armatimonadota bacterium]|nr:tripartite tricarboxylate transporter TctB family protein [Armatimonadota bacterium]